MDIEIGAPLRPWRQKAVAQFLAREALDYDPAIPFTVNLLDDDNIVATGSLEGNICKCIAVDPAYQGEGLTATIITQLRQEAFRQGLRHLFLYTKPKNRFLFEGLSFYRVAETADTLLMENVKGGVQQFVSGLKRPENPGTVGAIVANCNPFTLGHRYLVEQAAAQVDTLHLFVLSEDKSFFPAADRMMLVQQGVADLNNVIVHPTGDYLISAATFPTYFIKDKDRIPEIRCQLDLEVFANHFAPALGITRRFVGTEPLSPVTDAYNRQMMAFLPKKGIQVTLIQRKELGGAPISASRVRALLEEQDWAQLETLVPPTTLSYLKEHYSK
ncbi:MAG: [Clostridia bacterium]|nr:[citrate (pro-3S)-lyase] ligase [Clostridia bacterium]